VVSSRGYLGDPVVDPHEVGVFSKLGDDFTCVVPLGLPCYRGDRHKALLRSSVHPVGDLIQSLIEVSDGESFPEMSVSINSLPFVVTQSVLVFDSLIGRCVS
jgi:hypothetical protein